MILLDQCDEGCISFEDMEIFVEYDVGSGRPSV